MEGVKAIAERVRRGVERIRFLDINGNLRITASIGIAAHAGSAKTKAIFQQAGEALYHAKQTDSNKCVRTFPPKEMPRLPRPSQRRHNLPFATG
ncbi:MAG TPA: diguanylate cyclase [Burkholderiaceae bacterium]|nr:diguanylate cyclase [Burkholderiaceae bacterium]